MNLTITASLDTLLHNIANKKAAELGISGPLVGMVVAFRNPPYLILPSGQFDWIANLSYTCNKTESFLREPMIEGDIPNLIKSNRENIRFLPLLSWSGRAEDLDFVHTICVQYASQGYNSMLINDGWTHVYDPADAQPWKQPRIIEEFPRNLLSLFNRTMDLCTEYLLLQPFESH